MQYIELWENRSTIRTRPYKVFDLDKTGDLFPKNRQPLFTDQRIEDLPLSSKNDILLQSLFRYLNIIIKLELDLVNQVCSKIINNSTLVIYNENFQMAAYTVLIDEYYHVYMAQGIINNLKTKFHQKNINYKSDSIEAIKIIKNKLNLKYHDLFEIIAVSIFETTLIGELVGFFNVQDIHPSIGHYVKDHMNDEAKHAVFFSNILEHTWYSMSEEYRKAIGKVIPEFLVLYLGVKCDREFNKTLISNFFTDEDVELILNGIYKDFKINPKIPMVRNILRVLRDAKILDDQNIQNEFKKIDWDL